MFAAMQNISATILSFIILLQSFSVDFSDITKIDDLVKHIQVHLEQGENMLEFVSQHYGKNFSKHQNDHNGHQNLPFKHKIVDAQIQLVFCLSQIDFNIQINQIELVLNNFSYKKHLIKLLDLEFFQPPKTM